MNSFFRRINKLEPRGFLPQLEIFWKKAEGVYVFDKKKKKYLDFTSAIFLSNIGHANKELISSLKKVLNSKIIHSYNYPNPFREKYVKELLNFYGKKFNKKVFLLSGGSETLECAIKLIRLYGSKVNKEKKGIITLEGNWHGRTMGSQMLSSNKKGKEWVGYLDPNIYHLEFPYPWKVKEFNGESFFSNSLKKMKIKYKNIAGIILESFQGWGCFFYPKSYIKAIKRFCLKNKILLVFDEMQSGFGRTGEKFGYYHYDVEPNIICCGKGMGSGFPLSGIIGDSKILDLADRGSLSSTHSANPLACAAGLATLKELKNKKLIKKTKKLGFIFNDWLIKLKNKYSDYIMFTSSKGLIGAIIFKDISLKKNGAFIANKICNFALKRGLILVNTGRNSIKIGPPLVINEKQLNLGFNIIDRSFEDFIKKFN